MSLQSAFSSVLDFLGEKTGGSGSGPGPDQQRCEALDDASVR